MTKSIILKVTFILIIAALVLLTFGCGGGTVGGPEELSFQRVQAEQLPDEVQGWVYENIEVYGGSTMAYEGQLYILTAYGEKPTAGYLVEISKVEKQDGQIFVYTNFQDPDPEDMVATVITYPYDLVVIEDQDLPVIFK
jgi:hypothetical protein